MFRNRSYIIKTAYSLDKRILTDLFIEAASRYGKLDCDSLSRKSVSRAMIGVDEVVNFECDFMSSGIHIVDSNNEKVRDTYVSIEGSKFNIVWSLDLKVSSQTTEYVEVVPYFGKYLLTGLGDIVHCDGKLNYTSWVSKTGYSYFTVNYYISLGCNGVVDLGVTTKSLCGLVIFTNETGSVTVLKSSLSIAAVK